MITFNGGYFLICYSHNYRLCLIAYNMYSFCVLCCQRKISMLVNQSIISRSHACWY